MKPIFDRIIVEHVVMEEKTTSGLVIATARNTAPTHMLGKVLAVGPGAFVPMGPSRPMSVKVGDIVAFPSGNGFDMRVGDKNCRIMREEEVLGIVSEAA